MADFRYCKLEVFVPDGHLAELKQALQETDAGHIGKYDSCLSCSKVISCWRPLEGAQPYIGEEGEVCTEEEWKVEAVCFTEAVERTVEAIKRVHPYEEPVINVIPLYRTSF